MASPRDQCTDEQIQEEVSKRLLHRLNISASEVTVAVEGGRVIFDGTVLDLTMKHAIEELADRCPGVQDIQNRVKIGQ